MKRFVLLSMLFCFGVTPAAAIPTVDNADKADTVPTRSEWQQFAFERVGCGLREIFFKDVYVLSLYRGDLSAQMLRMDVVFDGDMPSGIPDDWRPPLSRVISQAEISAFNDAFTKLNKGDVVQFAYIPTADESYVLLNGDVRLGTPGPGLYDTVQGMWLGEDPISSKIKRNIENRVCDV